MIAKSSEALNLIGKISLEILLRVYCRPDTVANLLLRDTKLPKAYEDQRSVQLLW